MRQLIFCICFFFLLSPSHGQWAADYLLLNSEIEVSKGRAVSSDSKQIELHQNTDSPVDSAQSQGHLPMHLDELIPQQVSADEISQPEAPTGIDPTLEENVRAIVTEEDPDSLVIYKKQIHPNDVRRNKLEIDIRLGQASKTSKSEFRFKDYSFSSPNVGIRARFGLTPMVSFVGDFSSLVSGNIPYISKSTLIGVVDETSYFGLHYRKYQGLSRRASSFEIGLGYLDSQFRVPKSVTERIGQSTSGLDLNGTLRVSNAVNHTLLFSVKVAPALKAKEPASQSLISSGKSKSSYLIGASIGGEYFLERRRQITWNFGWEEMVARYSGSATPADPLSNQVMSDVKVSETLIHLSVGYRWGH